MATAMVFAVVVAGGGETFAGTGNIQIENLSDHPVKVVLPGSRAMVIESGADALEVEGTADDSAVGVTVRLWWTNDPRQLCQIFAPWGRTVTVSGATEIRCLAR